MKNRLDLTRFPRRANADSTCRARVSNAHCTRRTAKSHADPTRSNTQARKMRLSWGFVARSRLLCENGCSPQGCETRAIGAAGAQVPYKDKVGGSNPSSPTIETAGHRAVRPVASLFSAVAVPRFHGRSAAVAGSAALAFKQMLPVVSQTECLRARAAFDRQFIQRGASLFGHGMPDKSARSSAASSPCPLFDAKREGQPSASRISNAGDPSASTANMFQLRSHGFRV